MTVTTDFSDSSGSKIRKKKNRKAFYEVLNSFRSRVTCNMQDCRIGRLGLVDTADQPGYYDHKGYSFSRLGSPGRCNFERGRVK